MKRTSSRTLFIRASELLEGVRNLGARRAAAHPGTESPAESYLKKETVVLSFLLWCLLFLLCWPLALLALALYPIVWLLRFPFG